MMRCFNGLAGFLAGAGLIAVGATVSAGCGENFEGCAASRTCPSGGTAGTSGTGANDEAGSGGSGAASSNNGGAAGRGGGATGGKGARGGGGGSPSSEAGEGGSDGVALGSSGDGTGASPARGGSGGSGTSHGGAAGEPGDESSAADDVAPTVLATTPADNATGVVQNATISITFSEPMNVDSVAQAYASDDLPPNKVILSWADHNTRLVITPSELLEYAAVTGVDDPAREYSITIGGSATDVAGNTLEQEAILTFSTLRRISQPIPLARGVLLLHPHDGSDDWAGPVCKDNFLEAGDGASDQASASILVFEIGELSEGIVQWESAIVEGPFTTPAPDPFQDGLGELRGYSVRGKGIEITWSSPAAYVGVAAQASAPQHFSLDVKTALADYYDDPDEFGFELLLRFQNDTNADGTAQYISGVCTETWLNVVYVAP
jgi:hypothetical protein